MSGPSGPESPGGNKDRKSRADETDIQSRAYSAPESEQFSRLTKNKLDACTEPTSDCEIGVTVSDHGM